MASSAHDQPLPAIDRQHREEVCRELQATLVELIDLSLIGKQLHWNIFGPAFKPLHEHLDQLVDAWRDLSDIVAERAVALGLPPDGTAARVSTESNIAAVDTGPLATETALRELVDRLAGVTARVRRRTDNIDELDLASQDVLIEVVRELEKQLWMLRVSVPAETA